MSLQELLEAVHDLNNRFQVVLSACELAKFELDRRGIHVPELELAIRELTKKAMPLMVHMQSRIRTIYEEEKAKIQ